MRRLLYALLTIWNWAAIAALTVLWFPVLLLVRLTDRDAALYRTGRFFRLLGVAMTKVNPLWHIEFSGERIPNPRNPYVVVSNHQSLADIPILSHAPWEMKWVAKRELFKFPFAGWMMKLSGDIPLDRTDRQSGMRMMITAERRLRQHCSVMIFPEGTRSRTGNVGRFTDGAFHLAIRAGVPILPIAVEGSGSCLPKHSFFFEGESFIHVKVLPPIPTEGMTTEQAGMLRESARNVILDQVSAWRGVRREDVDGTLRKSADG